MNRKIKAFILAAAILLPLIFVSCVASYGGYSPAAAYGGGYECEEYNSGAELRPQAAAPVLEVIGEPALGEIGETEGETEEKYHVGEGGEADNTGEGADADGESVYAESEPEPAEPLPPPALSAEALLYDFDYLARILEENFPFYGPARRKFGLDLHRQKTLARAAVANLDTTGSESQILRRFTDVLAEHIITPMRSMGHIRGLWAGSDAHRIQLALIKLDGASEIPWYPNLYEGHLLEMFTSPAAIRYYGDIVLDAAAISRILQASVRPNNVTFDIIQPGSVAYIRMHTMNFANFEQDGQLIAAFGATIGGFDHLIIDLRGNTGGSASNFMQHIMAPLIDEPASLFYYVFFKGGSHALMFDGIYYRDAKWQAANGLILHTDAPRFPVSDILPYLPHANAADFARLSYGFKREVIVNPSASRWEFDGKIWILIDGRTFSASEISALLAKESGFATLVGAPTGGIFGGYTAAFIGLPNTGVIIRYDYGYVTDLQGRSLEEFGVEPHIRNRPGMNALETVLALIAEGNY